MLIERRGMTRITERRKWLSETDGASRTLPARQWKNVLEIQASRRSPGTASAV
jgi:hypothetical protein